MKISFRENGNIQKPVVDTQEEMKDFKRKKTPVAKRVGGVAAVIAVILAGIILYRMNTLYVYGIVSGNTAQVTAWFPTEIQKVHVSKGDVVKKGDVLFTQVSVEGEAQLKAAKANLNSKVAQYDLMTGAVASGEGDTTVLDPLKNERELLSLKQQGSAITRAQLQSEARYEQSRLYTLYEAKKMRYKNLHKLYQLDAATLSQVSSAETEKKLRYNEYVLARDHYNQVVKSNRIAEAEAEKEGRKLESSLYRDSVRTQTDFQSLLLDIETARAHLDQLQKRYGSDSYIAPFDGIITDLMVTDGSMLATGESILTSASRSHLWVDVYVDAAKASQFTEEKKILIYGGSDRKAIPGTISTKGTVELRVPQLLRDKMPGVSSAVYFHVMFENKGTIFPGNIVRVVVK